LWVGLALLIGGLWACGAIAAPADYEVDLAQAERQKLSAGETRSLNRADKVFSDNKFEEAAAEYEVFMKEFPRSAATPYALLRKGRAAQKTGDAGKALKLFTELMDFHSDSVACAAPALYYSGQCHRDLREQDEAIKAWKEVVEDKDYRKHPAAAYVLGSLAGAMREQGKTADAMKYYLREALEFPQTRQPVIEQLMGMNVREFPNVEAVRECIKALDGLEPQPRKELANDDKYFWETLRKAVRAYGFFHGHEREQMLRYYRYWIGVLDGKLPGDDEAQIELANYHRNIGLNEDDWIARMDKQFAALQKPGDYDRIVKWIIIYVGQPQKAEEYYAKLDFGKMKNESIVNLMFGLIQPLPDLAKRACANLRFDEMDDTAKTSLLVKVAGTRTAVSKDLATLILARMKDPDRGKMELLRFWVTVEHTKAEVMAENGLPLADHLVTIPAYAKEANGLKAGLLHRVGRYAEAIPAYQANNDPPKSLFGLADCYMALKQFDKAVEQWRAIAAKYDQRASEVAMKIAYAYRDAGKSDKYEAELRELARKYLPDTGVGQAARAELKALNKPEDK
jgi:tetratricopeptide (TPR) repeat protein